VFAGLRIEPRNITLLVGAVLQATTVFGPTGARIEWSLEDGQIARVAGDGVITSSQIGTTFLMAKAVAIRKQTGSLKFLSVKMVYRLFK